MLHRGVNQADPPPIVQYPSNSPFLFNFDDFTAMGEDFTPPEVSQPQLPEDIEVPEVNTESTDESGE